MPPHAPTCPHMPFLLQCMTLAQLSTEARDLTGKNALAPAGCIEVDTGEPHGTSGWHRRFSFRFRTQGTMACQAREQVETNADAQKHLGNRSGLLLKLRSVAVPELHQSRTPQTTTTLYAPLLQTHACTHKHTPARAVWVHPHSRPLPQAHPQQHQHPALTDLPLCASC